MANDFKRGIRVYLETSDYGKGIDAMVAATKKYETELAKLTEESKRMTAAGQDSGKAWDDNQRKLKLNETQLKKSQTAEADYRAKLQQTEKVLNNLSGSSYNELIAVQKQLQKEVKKGSATVEEQNAKLEQLRKVNTQVATSQSEMNSKIGATPSFLSRATAGFNKLFYAIIPLVAVFTSIGLAIKRFIDQTAQMEDIYANVSKVSNLTHEQVVALNEDFKKMDTRTARESLNALAVDAGKLGIEGRKNILDFVDAGNQIKVSLGEDLGEDAIKNIGKMVGVFDTSTKQLQGIGLKEQMLAVGSAINSIGQSSSASEQYLVDFSGRLGGVSKQAKISLADILGFASQLDQDMQHVEMAATSFQMFITKLMQDPAKFAKLAGLEVKAFTTLLSTDTNAAIKQVLTSLNEKGGFQALIPIFEDMNLDGSRAIGVLSSMAGSINKIDEAQKLANLSMTEGTSVTKEYNIKNENFAATLDKSGKKIKELGLAIGTSMIPLVTKAAGGVSSFVDILMKLPKWLNENKGLILSLVAVWTIHTTALYASIVADKLKIFWTEKVVLSLKSLWTTIKANPWGLIATGAVLAIGWLNKYLNKQKEVNVEQDKFNKLVEKTNELQTNSKSLEERAQIMKTLSKSQLESFKSDLETQISELEKHDAEIKTRADKALVNDAEYNKAKAKLAKARTDLEKSEAYTAMRWREEALLAQLGNEFMTNKKSLRELSTHLENVNNLIKTKSTSNDSSIIDEQKQKKEYDKQLKVLVNAKERRMAEIKKQAVAEKWTDTELKLKLLQQDEEFYNKKINLQKRYGQSYGDSENDVAETRLKINKLTDEQMLKAITDAYDAKKLVADKYFNVEKEKLGKDITDKEQYQTDLLLLEKQSAEARYANATDYLTLVENATYASENAKVEAISKAKDEQQKYDNARTDAAAKYAARQQTIDERTARQAEENAKARQAILDKYGLAENASLSSRYRKDLTELQNALDKKLITQEEYEKASGKMKLKYAEEYAQKAVQFAGYVADAVSSYHQLEADSLEAEKQRELTAAGDNAQAREAIEKEYAQKELDLKKKQSGADATIKIAQAIAAGALGVANIWAVHAANPILAGILTSIEAVTVGIQIASIVKQREQIMNTTLDSSSSGSSGSMGSGALVATPQAAHGRWDVIGEEDGRVYRNVPYRGVARTGIVATPTLMGEQGAEIVIDNPTTRNIIMNAPWIVGEIMKYRVPQRAGGKYDAIGTQNADARSKNDSNTAIYAMIIEMISKNNALLEYLKENGVDTIFVIDEFEKLIALRDKSKKKGSL